MIDQIRELQRINARLEEIRKPNSEYIAQKVAEIYTPEKQKAREAMKQKQFEAIKTILAEF